MNNCCMSLSGYTYCLNSQVSHDHPCYERNCLNYVHNCDDHGLLDFKSAVQYMKHLIYNSSSLNSVRK